MHGGAFNVRTGKACAAAASEALLTFPVEVEDGAVWLLAKGR